MKTFAIDENKRILVFASKKEAAASTSDSFTNQNEFAELTTEWPMQRLIGIWNGLPGVTPVSKFTSRKTAIERLWKAIQGFEAYAKPEVVETPAAEPTAPAESVPEPQAAAEEKQEAPAQPATPVIEPQATIVPDEPRAIAETPTQEGPARTEKARKASQRPKTEKTESGPREGSKTAQVVAMLQRDGGVTLSEIMSTMGWQKHTVRGFMAGTMKKAGYAVESFKPEGGERSYRIPAK